MTTPVLTYTPTVLRGQLGVDLDRLMVSRMLIQANSGGGKSRALRQLLEETFGRVQHLVIDPEGEFHTLREKYPYVLAAKSGGDVLASTKTAKLLCRRLMELGASAVLDLYELDPRDRAEFVRIFLTEMTDLPKALWRPCLVVVDEAHKFAPEKSHGESASTEAVVNWIALSRKRGFCPVLATQRLSKLHKDAAAELNNKLIGRTGLDIDMDRAAKELGFDKEKRQTLSRLEPGQFYAYGPAISSEVTTVITGKVQTTHPEPGQMNAAPPPPPAKVKAMLSQLVDLPQEAEQEARSIVELQKQVRQLKGDLTRAQKSPGAPDPATLERQVGHAVQKAITETGKRWLNTARDQAGRARRFADKIQKEGTELEAFGRGLQAFAAEFRGNIFEGEDTITPPERSPAAAPRPRSAPRARLPARDRAGAGYQIVDDTLSNPQQRMLDALASFEAIGVEKMAKAHVAVFSDQSSRSSGFRANLSTLSAKGLIERVDSESIRLTESGRAAASEAAAPASLDELHAAWKDKLSGPQRLMLELLLAEHPSGVERDDLAKNSGQSPLSSGYRANLSTLSALGLTKKEGGMILASDLLFPQGL